MRIEHPIRLAAGRAKIDRGSALYLSDEPIDGFRWEKRGDFYALTPGEALIAAFTEWARPFVEADGLARSLTRLEGAEDEDKKLLIDGIKLMDMGAAESTLDAYERRVRQRAALCLRVRSGGGLLPLCCTCLRAAR